MLLMALVFYLWYEAPEDEKNFPMVMEMLRAGEVREDDDSYQSPLDELFDRLEMRSPDHIAVKYYKDYRSRLCQNAEIHSDHVGVPPGEIQSFLGGGSYRHG